ncbi:MAG: hypothetical protein IPL71_20130 [Anaerolineales bacterium]|nr:hypothetical protein [Anaerolineales bacterium]
MDRYEVPQRPESDAGGDSARCMSQLNLSAGAYHRTLRSRMKIMME